MFPKISILQSLSWKSIVSPSIWNKWMQYFQISPHLSLMTTLIQLWYSPYLQLSLCLQFFLRFQLLPLSLTSMKNKFPKESSSPRKVCHSHNSKMPSPWNIIIISMWSLLHANLKICGKYSQNSKSTQVPSQLPSWKLKQEVNKTNSNMKVIEWEWKWMEVTFIANSQRMCKLNKHLNICAKWINYFIKVPRVSVNKSKLTQWINMRETTL